MYVYSIFLYVCEIWGFYKVFDIEKVYFNFCKRIFGVNKRIINNLVYYELGRFFLYIRRKLWIFKYWLKIKNINNIILKEVYESMFVNNDNWMVFI